MEFNFEFFTDQKLGRGRISNGILTIHSNGCITIPATVGVSLKVGEFIDIGLTGDRKHLALKNGTITKISAGSNNCNSKKAVSQTIRNVLKNSGILLPAKYLMHQDGDMWVGELQ